MRAILIDPYARIGEGQQAVTQVEIGDGLAAMYRALSDQKTGYHCSVVEVATEDDRGNVYWVDEEGLMKGHAGHVLLHGGHQPFAGRMLVTGSTADGGNADVDIDFHVLARRVGTITAIPGGAEVGVAQGEDWVEGRAMGSFQSIAAYLQEFLDLRMGGDHVPEETGDPGL